MSVEKMRKEFEDAFVDEMASRCGEGFRSSVRLFFVEKEPDGAYSNPIAHAGWWAWQASRAALVIELPDYTNPFYGGDHFDECQYAADVEQVIEAAGLKVK